MLDLHDMPGHLIRRLNQVSVSLFMEEATKAGYDLTPVQFAALSAIEAYPGADQATISGVIAYDRVTIGGVVDRLTQKGFVRRGSRCATSARGCCTSPRPVLRRLPPCDRSSPASRT